MCSGEMQTENSRQCSKVFIGGLSWETTGEKLRAYFENYGVVREAFVSYNRNNGRPRGFGFVVFESPEVADKVVASKHTIDRREVEAKKAVPKDEQQLQGDAQQHGSQGSGSGPGSTGPDGGPSSGPSSGAKSRKIFVGGLAPSVDEAALRQHFEVFGPVEDAVVMYDHDNKRPRGFGFVTFAAEDAIELVFAKGAMQTIQDKQIEIKSAVPRDQMPPTMRPSQAYPFDPRFAPGPGPGPRGPPGLYSNPYLSPQGLPSQFVGLPLGAGRGGYGGGGPRGMVPTAGPQPGSRAPGRYDPTSGLGQLHGSFPQQQQHAQHPQAMHSQGLGAAAAKAPPMSMQQGGGGGGYGFPLPNGAAASAGMFGAGSPASLVYNLASLQQQALNGMHPGGPPSGPAAGSRGAGKHGGHAYGPSPPPASGGHQLTNLKALALASGLGAFQGGAGPDGEHGGAAAFSQQQPSESDYAEAAAAVNAAAAAGLVQVTGDYSYRDGSSFSTAPAPGWSS